MSENPFVLFLSAIIPSVILVCVVALLCTVTARGMSKSSIELSAAMLTNVAQFSAHAKAGVGFPNRRPETRRSAAEPGSGFGTDIGVTNASLTSELAAMSPLSKANSVEQAEAINPIESTSAELEGKLRGVEQSEPSRPEPAEGTPASAEANYHGPSDQRKAHVRQSPEVKLIGKPQLRPAALSPSVKPTASAAKAPAGSAIVRSYGARVWAKLASHKPITTDRGGTTVTFEIGASGALVDVRVSQSSGNSQLDQLALQTVRNSAPFPRPPNGASTYTISIDFQ